MNLKIFSHLKSVKGSAVWQDYRDVSGNIPFSRKTLIYGFNGTGKTTLSRIFDSLRGNELVGNLPNETEFEVVLSDGQTVSSDSFSKPLGNNLLVFNSDFINRNFKWDESRANPIFYLSETNIRKKEEFDEAHNILDLAQGELENASLAYKNANKQFGNEKTKIARRVRDLALSGSYTQGYDARKVEPTFAERKYSDDDILSSLDLSDKQALLNQSEPLPEIPLISEPSLDLSSWSEKLTALLKKSISSDAMEHFEKHTNMLGWAGEGFDYHRKNDLEECLFCGNNLSGDRKLILQKLFDTGLRAQQLEVEESEKYCQTYILSLGELSSEIPKVNEIQDAERIEFEKISTILKETILKADEFLKYVLPKISEKKKNLTKNVDVSAATIDAEIHKWYVTVLDQISSMNDVVSRHNDAFNKFQLLQSAAFEKIRNHIFAEELLNWQGVISSLNSTKVELDAATSKVRLQKQKTDRLDNELREQGIGANKVSELLKSYLGHDSVRLKSVEDGYQLVRANGRSAKNLSEGEKTALAFCFFLSQFESEGRNKKELVVVIDDPISSLDTTAKTHAFSLLRKMTKNCAQTIILTHNMGFMNMIKREFCNRNSDENASLLQIHCTGANEQDRKSVLTKMNSLLSDYDTEYHYLFEIVFNAAKNGKSDFQFLLPNATRKMLEMFSTFAAPSAVGLADALGQSGVTLEENNLKSLERLVQIESHGTIEGMGNLPELTVEEAIKACNAAMEFIRKRDGKHFRAMLRVINREG